MGCKLSSFQICVEMSFCFACELSSSKKQVQESNIFDTSKLTLVFANAHGRESEDPSSTPMEHPFSKSIVKKNSHLGSIYLPYHMNKVSNQDATHMFRPWLSKPGQPTNTLVPWRQGFRHRTRNECMGWFAQI